MAQIANGEIINVKSTAEYQIVAQNLTFVMEADGATSNQINVNQSMILKVAEGTTLTFNTNGQAASIVRL